MSTAAATPAPAFLATPAEPAACAQSLRLDGTLKTKQWQPVLAAVAAAVEAHDAAEDAKVARRRMLGNAVIAAAFVAAGVLLLSDLPGALAFIAFAALLITGFVVRHGAPERADPIGSERIEFITSLLDQLGRFAPDARLALAARVDCRPAFAAATAQERTVGAKTVTLRSAGECWLRGRLTGLKGLTLDWSVIETNTLKQAKGRNARGKTKIKVKFATARRFTLRLDADGALFTEKAAAPDNADAGLTVEVRGRPQGPSVRGRRDTKSGGPLASTQSLEAPLGRLRRAAREAGLDAAVGAEATPLVQLMMRCEQRLTPREFNRKAA